MYPVSFVHDRNDQVQQWPLLPTAWMVPHDQREQLWIRLMVDMAPAKVSESEGSWAGKGRPYSVGFWCPRHWGEEEIWRSSLIISPPLGWLWTGSLIGCCEMNNAMPVNLTDTSFIIFILKSIAVSHSFLQIIICQWLVKILLARWWLILSVVKKESVCHAGDLGLIPGLGRSPGEGSGDPLQHSCLQNPMDRGAWGLTVMGSQRSQKWLGNWKTTVKILYTIRP